MRGKHNRIWFDSPAQKQPPQISKKAIRQFSVAGRFFVKSEKDPHSKGRALQMLFDRPRKGVLFFVFGAKSFFTYLPPPNINFWVYFCRGFQGLRGFFRGKGTRGVEAG